MTEAQKFDRFHADVETQTGEVIAMLENMMERNLIAKKDIRKIISQVTRKVRAAVAKNYLNSMHAGKNRRMAQKGVKMSIWKKTLGSSVSLYSSKKKEAVELDDKVWAPKNRYRPRRARALRTIAMQSYYGKDASMILRWYNCGTDVRKTGGRFSYYMGQRRGWRKNVALDKSFGGHDKGVHDSLSISNRGRMPSRGFFEIADDEMDKAADILGDRLLDVLTEIANE